MLCLPLAALLLQVAAPAMPSDSMPSPDRAAGPRVAPAAFVHAMAPTLPARSPLGDTTRTRARASEVSDGYATRLTIHRWASYAELPLFAGEFVLGTRLLDEERVGVPSSGLKTAHGTVAAGLAALFAVNTVTGAWNWWETRHEPEGRAKRTVHALLLLAADAGFAYTGTLTDQARLSTDGAERHRAAALTSIGIATAGTLLMWFF